MLNPKPLYQQILAALFICLAGCSSNTVTYNAVDYSNVDTTSLTELENLKQGTAKKTKSNKNKGTNAIRLQALKETATTLGAQGALAFRSGQINKILEKNRQSLDQIFNFQALLLDNDILPPVLAEGRQTLNLPDDDTIRIADQTYTILQQARFATAPPNWRNYLWLSYPKPEVPDATLLPRYNVDAEVTTWLQSTNEGWTHGLNQANSIFTENIARLKRDYQGMALYRKLLSQKMISAPYVATTNLGVTGGGNRLSINDQLKRMTARPELNANSQEWTPAVAQPYLPPSSQAAAAAMAQGGTKPPSTAPAMRPKDPYIDP